MESAPTTLDKPYYPISERTFPLFPRRVNPNYIGVSRLRYTKDIRAEGSEEEITDILRRLVNIRQEIAIAETSQHRLEAVLATDSLLVTARSLRY